jgi:hypothetical protein
MRRILKFLLDPFLSLILRTLRVDDPWERFSHRVPLHVYGGGSRRDFQWYFEGESAVEVKTLEDIQDWLLGCEYAHDLHLFQEHDFWQHPRTFEQLKKGDCEDHALWAWRKCVELGIEAELVSGQQLSEAGVSDEESGHVWVVLKRDDETFVFETAAKSKDRMLKPLREVRAEYRPEVGVDAKRNRFAYFGWLLTLKEQRERRKMRRTA